MCPRCPRTKRTSKTYSPTRTKRIMSISHALWRGILCSPRPHDCVNTWASFHARHYPMKPLSGRLTYASAGVTNLTRTANSGVLAATFSPSGREPRMIPLPQMRRVIP
jgi:hypothetical protein